MEVKKATAKTEPAIPATKDKNGNILSIGHTVRDAKGKEWKLENLLGVSMATYSENGKRLKAIILKKFDLTTCVKVA